MGKSKLRVSAWRIQDTCGERWLDELARVDSAVRASRGMAIRRAGGGRRWGCCGRVGVRDMVRCRYVEMPEQAAAALVLVRLPCFWPEDPSSSTEVPVVSLSSGNCRIAGLLLVGLLLVWIHDWCTNKHHYHQSPNQIHHHPGITFDSFSPAFLSFSAKCPLPRPSL